jgi:hypothetical protein
MTRPEKTGSRKGGGLTWRQGAFLAEGVAQIGCLTLVIVIAALGAGLWLDSRLGTRPWFTLGLVLASIPVSLVALVYTALSVGRRAQMPPPEGDVETQRRREAEMEGQGEAEVGDEDSVL